MSLVRILPAWFHGAADYGVAFLLILTPLFVHPSGGALFVNVVVGAVVLGVSMLTAYPLGVDPIMSFKTHSLFDYVGAALLFAGPYAFGYWTTDNFLARGDILLGAAVLGVSLITNYQYSPNRVGAVAA